MSLFGGLFHALFGGGGPKKPNPVEGQLAPYLKQYSDIANSEGKAADAEYTKADKAYDTSLDFFNKVLTGTPEQLGKMFDSSQITKQYDDQERENYELAPRGGRRAAAGMNIGFDKTASLNSFIQNLRGQAAGQIGSLAQAISGLAQGRLTGALAGLSGASGLVFNTKQISLQEKQIRNELIGSIFEAAGTALGGIFCNTLDTWILMADKQHKQLKDVNVGDRVLSPIDYSGDGDFIELKVIRKEVVDERDIYKLIVDGSMIRGTLNHVIIDALGDEITLEKLKENLPVVSYMSDNFVIKPVKSLNKEMFKAKVAILKLKDEKQNYKYITNGLVSVDADCTKG